MELACIFALKVASSFLQVVIEKLANPAFSEIDQVRKVDKKLSELRATYLKIQALLDQRDGWHINDSILESWLQQLVGYCYDTEDLIDDVVLSCSIKGEDQELQGRHPVRNSIVASLSPKKWATPRKIVKLRDKLESLRSEIESVLPAGANNSTHTYIGEPSVRYCESLLPDGGPPLPETSRDQDKLTIILKLTSLQCHPSGVSIIGMDGVGKTTLAQAIMDDKGIKEHFSLVLSACVSGNFKEEDIVQKLLQAHSRMTWPQSHPPPAEPYERDLALHDLLNSETPLIILDDLWDVSNEDWKIFTRRYLGFSPGWRILITTRYPKVAEVTRSEAYYLYRMTDEDCKAVIIDNADLNESELQSRASDIELIAEKCKGMPIVAKMLGDRLSSAAERSETFRQFKRGDLWELREFRDVLPSLRLDEPKLTLDLKRCFAYCSLFPLNHEFNKDDLIRLWEVEGFVEHEERRGSQRTGSVSFDDLLSRALLQPRRSTDNNQTIYKMHEFSHKFAQRLAYYIFRRIDAGKSDLGSSCENIRHLSLCCQSIDKSLLEKIAQYKGLRTFLLVHPNNPGRRDMSCTFLGKLESLRLLDLSNTNISKLQKHIFPFKHLRYLDLSNTDIKTLPKVKRPPRALQILKLENCSELIAPKDFNTWISLTHLHVNMKSVASPPSNIGKLTNLETLRSYSVSKKEGHKVAELKNMKRLREICITCLENIENKEEAKEALLNEKPLLRRLVLEWDSTISNVVNAEDVLEGLQPDGDLRDLEVRNYTGQQFPTWLTSPSCKLVSIYLDNCLKCQVLPSLGQLPLLKTLVIGSMPNVEVVDDRFCGQGGRAFPCLESLNFRDMEGLVNWIGLEAEAMPCLCTLKIVECPSLSTLPPLNHLSCLLRLEISHCPVLQSLPELPSSLNGKSGELIITDCALVKERSQVGGDDWPKIKEIPCVKIDSTQISTGSSSSPPKNIKTTVEKATELFSRLRVNFRVGFWIIVLALLLLPGFIRLLVASSK